MTITRVLAPGPELAAGTRAATVRASPAPGTPTRAGHVVTLPAIATRARAHTPPAIRALGTGLRAEGAGEAGGTLALPGPVVARAVAWKKDLWRLFVVMPVLVLIYQES